MASKWPLPPRPPPYAAGAGVGASTVRAILRSLRLGDCRRCERTGRRNPRHEPLAAARTDGVADAPLSFSKITAQDLVISEPGISPLTHATEPCDHASKRLQPRFSFCAAAQTQARSDVGALCLLPPGGRHC